MEKTDKLKPLNKKKSTKWLGTFDQHDQEEEDLDPQEEDWYFDKPEPDKK